MTHQKTQKVSKLMANALLILLFAFALNQTFQVALGQANTSSNNQWAMSLSAENSQNITSTTFAPFDLIQLIATGNLWQCIPTKHFSFFQRNRSFKFIYPK